MILTAADLLSRDPDPSDDDDPARAARQPLPLHRATRAIVESVRAGAAALRSEVGRDPGADAVRPRVGPRPRARAPRQSPTRRRSPAASRCIPVMKLRIARPSLVVDISAARAARRRGARRRAPHRPAHDVGRAGPRRSSTGPRSRRSPSARAGSATSRCGTAGRWAGASRTRTRPPTCRPSCSRSGATLHAAIAGGRARASRSRTSSLGPFTTALGAQELDHRRRRAHSRRRAPAPRTSSVEHPASGFALAGAAALAGPDGRDAWR